MIEAPRETVSLSRPPAAETPRHLQKPCDQSGTVDETTDLKALARLALARASPRSTNPDGMARGFQTELARPTQSRRRCLGCLACLGVSRSQRRLGPTPRKSVWQSLNTTVVRPVTWAEALTRLDPARPPCDIPLIRWLRFIDDCGRFLDDGWAACAEGLGWGPLDLFGCDRTNASPASTALVCSGCSTVGDFSLSPPTRQPSPRPAAAILPSGGAFVSRAACWRGSCRLNAA